MVARINHSCSKERHLQRLTKKNVAPDAETQKSFFAILWFLRKEEKILSKA